MPVVLQQYVFCEIVKIESIQLMFSMYVVENILFILVVLLEGENFIQEKPDVPTVLRTLSALIRYRALVGRRIC